MSDIMPLENLSTFQRLHPTAVIQRVDHQNDSIFFLENDREWVMIFEETEVAGVWDMTPNDDWESTCE